jgi:hypothetical protein
LRGSGLGFRVGSERAEEGGGGGGGGGEALFASRNTRTCAN